eukprot:gene13136-17603_t
MSVWVQSRSGNEEAFKVDFNDGMDFADLKQKIIFERIVLNLPAGAVQSIHSENSDEERFKLKPGTKVPIPVDGQIGSSDDLPYFFFIAQTQAVGGNPSTPGDAEVMFLVLKLTRGKGKKNNGEIIEAVPVGTSFALSDKLLFTAAHNVCNAKHVALGEIGVVRVYEAPVLIADIEILTHEIHCCDKDEDWAVYKRSSGNFTHSVQICPEHELPAGRVKIGIKDFPVGLAEFVTKVTLDSFHTKISNYQVFSDSVVTKKRKFAVTKTKPATAVERAIQVVGGRVTGSCGAAYFGVNGKVVAFHKENGREEVSLSNSYSSDRSHTSYSVGLVLCRLSKFKAWYNDNTVGTAI